MTSAARRGLYTWPNLSMDSQLSPEAYRQLLDVVDCDENADLVSRNHRHQQQVQYPLLSFLDWDILDDAGAARLLDQYARARATTASGKRRLCKPTVQYSTVLPPLPVPSPVAQHHTPGHLHLPSYNSITPNLPSDDNDSVSRPSQKVSSPQRHRATSPSKVRKPPSVESSVTSLPPLDIQVLQRKRVFLNATGAATIGVEKIVQLHERVSPPMPRASPLQLAAIPKKCTSDDEIALMPCHSLQYRFAPSLSAECWREPVRDRDKNWSKEELNVILALHRTTDQAKNSMTNPLRQRKGKWRRWETMKLHIHGAVAHEAASSHREQGLPQQILIRNQAVMISSTYCVVSVFGVGVFGRLYSPGLSERHGSSRFLRFEAYDPRTSRKYDLVVTMSDLEWLFQSRQQLLVAGKKHVIVKELIALLFFKHPDNEEENGEDDDNVSRDATSHSNELQYPNEQHQNRQQSILTNSSREDLRDPPKTLHQLPVLCISPEEKLSEAVRRRLEREERLRLAEEERLRAQALLLKLPRRARHRLLCQIVRVSGHKMIVSLYHFPAQIRSFAILAYHPLSSRTFSLSVGVMEAASLSHIFTLPHKWSSEQKLLIAQSLIPMLRFNGVQAKRSGNLNEEPVASSSDYASYRMSLAIRDGRAGAPSEWLGLPRLQTSDELREEIVRKYQMDGQRSLKLTFDAKMQVLDAECCTKATEVDVQTGVAEDQKAALQARDMELRDLIEEINSGKNIAGSSDATSTSESKSPHELRRAYKAERQRIKDDLKALNEQVAAWNRELAVMREKQAQERQRMEKTFEKAARDLENDALINTRGFYEAAWMSTAENKPRKSKHRVHGQRTWLARPHIAANTTLVASEACVIAGRRYRCSVFRATEPPLASLAGTTQSQPSVASVTDTELPHCGTTVENSQVSPIPDMLLILLYDPESSSTWTLELAQLDWISYTKQHHDAQLLVPQFEIPSSPVTDHLKALRTALTANRDALAKTYAAQSTTKKKKKKTTATSNKVAKLRAQLRSEMKSLYFERRKLDNAAPWHRMISAMGDRISFPTPDVVAVDQCIFRATLPIVSLVGDIEDEDAGPKGDGNLDMIYCDVRVLQWRHKITFVVVDPNTQNEFSLAYPDSAELVKEFAVETFMEQQMHLEAIAMTLLFFVNESTGKRDIRFED